MNAGSIEDRHERISSLRDQFVGMGPDQDDAVADRIRDLAAGGELVGDPLVLEDLLVAIPWLRESDIALDAGIQVALAYRGRQERDSVARDLVGAHPELEQAVRRAVILADLVDSTHNAAELSSTLPIQELPAEIGPPDLSGRPRYELRSLIGAGCQGAVYTAVDRLFSKPESPRIVAIKVNRRVTQSSIDLATSEEAIRACRVQHPSVVRVLDHGVAAGSYAFAAFELVDGVPLDTWVLSQSGQISAREAAAKVALICDGVQAAHSAGLIHRDLKPSNILIDRSGHPKIADFGIAREQSPQLDSSSVYCSRGSLAFVAPEQFRRETGSDAPVADVYALGGLLYWLLTGRFPNGDTAVAAIDRLSNEEPAGPELSPELVPHTLARIITRALSHSPQVRHGSAQALADDLRSWLRHRPIGWLRPSLSDRTILFVRRGPVRVIAAVVVLASIIGLLGMVIQARADARIQAAELASEARETALRSELQRIEERQAAQDERVRDAQSRIRAWMGLLNATGFVEPGEYLAVIGSLSRLELFQEASVAELLDQNRIEVGRQVVSGLESEGHGDSLEAAIWNGLVGTWLLRSDRPVDSIGHFEAAQRRLGEVLKPEDPWLEQIRTQLAQARTQAGDPLVMEE